MELYKYEPLTNETSIRILALQPCLSYDAELRCDLVHSDRDTIPQGTAQVPHYEPVSYVWGSDPAFSHTLITTDELRIPITANVDEILRVLRKPTKTRFLWIDAICLNQNDLAEKAEQVPLMGMIFSQGRKTHIYLSCAQSLERPLRILRCFDNPRGVRESVPIFIASNLREAANSVSGMLLNPWFTRRWVLQEAAFSRHADIRSRHYSISWEVLQSSVRGFAALMYARHVHLLDPVHEAINMVTSLAQPFQDVDQLLKIFYKTECSMAVDRIYSLYGLVGKERHLLPPVDYNLRPDELCVKLAVHMTREGSIEAFFDSLIFFGNLHNLDPILPSWAPAWCIQPRPSSVELVQPALRRPINNANTASFLGSIWHIRDDFASVRERFPATPIRSFHDFEMIMHNLNGFVSPAQEMMYKV